MLGLGLSIPATAGVQRRRDPPPVPEPADWAPEAQAYFAALAVQPNAARKSRINTLIVTLKDAGIWQRLAGLNVVGRDLNAFATDLVNPARVGIAVNGPAYVADTHFKADGVSSYLNTIFNPTTDGGGRFLQNDCGMAMACSAPYVALSNSKYDCGNDSAWLTSQYNDTAAACRAQATSVSYARPRGAATSTDPELIVAWNRSTAAQALWYVEGVVRSTMAVASAPLLNAPFAIGAIANSPTFFSRFSGQGIRFFRYGLSLTAEQELIFRDTIVTYFNGLASDYA